MSMKLREKNLEIKRHLLKFFSEKKWDLLLDNAKSQNQIQKCDGCLKSSLKIELGNFLSESRFIQRKNSLWRYKQNIRSPEQTV